MVLLYFFNSMFVDDECLIIVDNKKPRLFLEAGFFYAK
jgi:hypothetical protein